MKKIIPFLLLYSLPIFSQSDCDFFAEINNDELNDIKGKAQKDSVSEQYILAYRYSHGIKGVTKNIIKAIYWFNKCSETEGYYTICAHDNLGTIYYMGEGIPKDFEKAAYHYAFGANNGDMKNQDALGDIYSDEKSKLKDYEEAVYWYTKSAEQGFPAAQFKLGLMYDVGQGVLTNKNKAIYWYAKSAEKNYPPAEFNLGLLYFFGEGVKMDKKLAAYWIRKSYENENSFWLKVKEAKEFWEQNELWKYE